MPSREEHLKKDRELFGKEFNEVHRILDQFSHFPDEEFLRRHRKFLHHHEGIEYIRMRFGDEAADSARQHIIDDCGHVPDAIDYYTGNVGDYGEKVYRI